MTSPSDKMLEYQARLALPQRLPLYKQVAAVLRQRIKRGDFDQGQQLPPVRQLVTELGVSHGVAQRALQFLQSERLVESRPAIGSRLVTGEQCDATAFLFGFIQPETDLWSYALYHQLEKTLEHRSNLCVMRTSNNDSARERWIIDHLVSNGINGLLLLPVDADTNRAYLSELARQLPIVLVDRTIAGLKLPSVVLNYRKLGHQVVNDFVKRGCRRILFLDDPVKISSYGEFRKGMVEAIEQHGLQRDYVRQDFPLIETVHAYQLRGDNAMMEQFFQMTASLLESERFDAMYCPQNELMRLLFCVDGRANDVLPKVALATSLSPAVDAPRRIRDLHRIGVKLWGSQNEKMLSQGMDVLQEIVMTRRTIVRRTRLDFLPIEP